MIGGLEKLGTITSLTFDEKPKMNKKLNEDIGLMEGRTCLLGREGQIYIDSPMVCKHHAEIKIINGKTYLRDLNSTNGAYLFTPIYSKIID